jgi:hypothetical protein
MIIGVTWSECSHFTSSVIDVMVILPTFIVVLQACVNYLTPFGALDFYHFFSIYFLVIGTGNGFIKIGYGEDYLLILRDVTDDWKTNY